MSSIFFDELANMTYENKYYNISSSAIWL